MSSSVTRIADMEREEFARKLRQGCLSLSIPPFEVVLTSSLQDVADGIRLLYGDYKCSEVALADYHVSLEVPSWLRAWYRPQVNFFLDGLTPYKPLPRSQALPMFEWGMNWCVSTTAHQFLILHAAVVEKNGVALVMPAPPGSGKSTLCAGLVCRGWRLLSDEMAMITASVGGRVSVKPFVRPISLKNQSIDVIRAFSPEAVIGPSFSETQKGTVAHVKPPSASVTMAEVEADPRWVVFPKYVPGSSTSLTKREKALSYMELAQQAFNLNVLGDEGVERLNLLVSQVQCYDFYYSDLDDAVLLFDCMADGEHA